MALQERVVLIDDLDWQEFQHASPSDPGAYAAAALGVEGDRLRQERERGRGGPLQALFRRPRA